MSNLQGKSIIGGDSLAVSVGTFSTKSRLTGETMEPEFHTAPSSAVDLATDLATEAFKTYKNATGAERAAFLRKIADRLEAIRPELVARANAETALPEARLNGELGRTTGQLKMFADIVEAGDWVDLRVDEALPDRQPAPRPEIKSQFRPLGPVAVFGASNFPLAFSVAGGDTASALAAGCPVIAKAHPAHPGTSELVGREIALAVADCGLPAGVFSLLIEEGIDLGKALVIHPAIQAVGFTGSRKGGLALVAAAQWRKAPIPVYAEMSSINPVVVLPGKLSGDPEGFAAGLQGSVTMGVGQFCTNPGLILFVGEAGYAEFEAKFVELMSAASAGTMLTQRIGEVYVENASTLGSLNGVETLVEAKGAGAPAVYKVSSADFKATEAAQAEVFGPSTLLVLCADVADAVSVIEGLEGQLTGSVFGVESDLESVAVVGAALENMVGRLIYNQFPTGVEVCSSMVHGGPFPSTSDSRTTSVGGRAISRWARPIAYQNWPV